MSVHSRTLNASARPSRRSAPIGSSTWPRTAVREPDRPPADRRGQHARNAQPPRRGREGRNLCRLRPRRIVLGVRAEGPRTVRGRVRRSRQRLRGDEVRGDPRRLALGAHHRARGNDSPPLLRLRPLGRAHPSHAAAGRVRAGRDASRPHQPVDGTRLHLGRRRGRRHRGAAEGAADRPGAVWNLGSGEQTTLEDLVGIAREVFGVEEEPSWGNDARPCVGHRELEVRSPASV